MSTEINWPLFERTVAAIEANPRHWNQGVWHCGTSHCFAGFCHIIDLADRGKLQSIELELMHDQADGDEDSDGWVLMAEDSEFRSIDALGVSRRQADWLFNANRTRKDFRECIERRAVPVHNEYFETVWP